ncbi:hypothetical protein NONO_c18100 [Nocardia nova SH22a]|uniref:Metallothionein n=1 Tax=Nocardia nova SH22a TaxID=1415166 RepID=W5TB63_9NOCA|nr:hypothetical protein NONO_c18100 [Nocardia nova SH22a]
MTVPEMSYYHCGHCGIDTTYDPDSEEGAYCRAGCTDLCSCGHPVSQHDVKEYGPCTACGCTKPDC